MNKIHIECFEISKYKDTLLYLTILFDLKSNHYYYYHRSWYKPALKKILSTQKLTKIKDIFTTVQCCSNSVDFSDEEERKIIRQSIINTSLFPAQKIIDLEYEV